MKETTVSLRISKQDRQKAGKAAREHKNLSAFFLQAANSVIRYQRLLKQIKALEKQGVPLKALEVRRK